MTNKQNTTEELLQTGKNISLSAGERDEMKSTLLSYAQYHGVKEKTAPRRAWTSLVWVRTMAASAVALVLFVGTGYASTDSLPGEPLYALKVNVVEELVTATKFTEQSQLAHNTVLTNRRLAEVRELARTDRLTAESVTALETELDELVFELHEIIESDTDGSLTTESTLEATNNTAAITAASNKIVRTKASADIAELLEDVVDDAAAFNTEEMQDFITSASDDMISQYIADQLQELSQQVSAGMATSTRLKTQEYIEEVRENIETGNIDTASILISEAVLLVDTDEFEVGYETKVKEEEPTATSTTHNPTPDPAVLDASTSTATTTDS